MWSVYVICRISLDKIVSSKPGISMHSRLWSTEECIRKSVLAFTCIFSQYRLRWKEDKDCYDFGMYSRLFLHKEKGIEWKNWDYALWETDLKL